MSAAELLLRLAASLNANGLHRIITSPDHPPLCCPCLEDYMDVWLAAYPTVQAMSN